MTKLRIEHVGDIIEVYGSYNAEFSKKARQAGGSYHSSDKSWQFPDDREELVVSLVKECYGFLPEDLLDLVSVEIKASAFEGRDGEIRIGSVLVAKRWSRDKAVQLYNAYVIEGEFSNRGGSAAYPRVDAKSDIVLVVDGVPRKALEGIGNDYYKIIEKKQKYDKEALKAEKEKLLEKLAKIELLLAE